MVPCALRVSESPLLGKETTPDSLPGIDPGDLSAPAIVYLAAAVPHAAKPRAIRCP